MFETVRRINWKTHWCQRNKCQGTGQCQYTHNCKLMTLAEAAIAKGSGTPGDTPMDEYTKRRIEDHARVGGRLYNDTDWTPLRAAERLRREEQIKQQTEDEEMCRRSRNNRIEAMLEAHNLSLYDLEKWVKETINGG